MTDYLILGGGLTGCVIASRLKQYLPGAKVTLVEAGPDEHENPMLREPMNTPLLHNSSFQYNYKTTPQKHYDNRQVFHAGGKVLSGSSSVNYATWTRGDKADYDLWGRIVVDDKRWSYEGQLPYFRRTEHHHDPAGDVIQHGFNGPIHTTLSLSRTYPLTEKIKAAFIETGAKLNDDLNSGDNKGLAAHIENWRDGKRQFAGKCYDLTGVDVLTNSPVRRIILEKKGDAVKATGAELVSGQILHASKEVILTCGAIRSPQILLLSSIGPADELQKHGMEQIVNSPNVGKNFHEHLAVTQFFKVKNPEKGVCAPHPNFVTNPTYASGFPIGYLLTDSAPSEIVKKALEADGQTVSDQHPQIDPPRSHYEIIPFYAPTEVPLTGMNIPLDGTILSVGVINLLHTSRGSVTLNSADPTEDPAIDPNYYGTETDKAILRAAIRRNMSVFETEHGREIVADELPPEGYPMLTSKSTDEEIDARVRRAATTFFHVGGTAAMGDVVDTDCRVKGVQSLRVVDGSVFPVPIAAHYQAASYALAEQMAERISNGQ